jgi:hypothetical protein
MIPFSKDLLYQLNEDVAVEDFHNGSLLFLARQNRLIDLNHSARHILRLLNEKQNLNKVIDQTAHDFGVDKKSAGRDVHRFIADLFKIGAIRFSVKNSTKRRKAMDKSAAVLAIPRISLREEEDGAILFDVETNGLLIVNPVGLLIWKHILTYPRTRKDIVIHLNKVCNEVPQEQVEADVEAFLSELHNKGFIQEIVNDKNKHG